nr:hypothetical protein Iba_chr01aCG16740 [Ipomoea batatas]
MEDTVVGKYRRRKPIMTGKDVPADTNDQSRSEQEEVYSADGGGESQISILNLNKGKEPVDGKFAGMQHKKSVIVCWMPTRGDYRDLILQAQRADYKPSNRQQMLCSIVAQIHVTSSSLWFMAGTLEKQASADIDVRSKAKMRSMAFRVESKKSSDSQSALIKSRLWSPRRHLTSHLVSVDPVHPHNLI